MLSRWLRQWLASWHGRGEAHQYEYYRCEGCRGLVTWRRIRRGGCGCGAIRLKPACLTFGEKARLLLTPWTV